MPIYLETNSAMCLNPHDLEEYTFPNQHGSSENEIPIEHLTSISEQQVHIPFPALCKIVNTRGTMSWPFVHLTLVIMENALTAFVDHLKCAVCLELPSDPSSLPCNHCFCKKCILLALDHKPQCPICKQTTTRRKAKTNEMVAEIVKNVILFKSAQEDMDNSTENGTENGTENSTEDGTEYDSSQTKQKLGKRVPLQMVKQGNNELMQRNEWMPKRAAMDCSLTGMFHIVTTQVPSTELKTVKICTDRMKSTLHNAWNVDTTHVVLPARSELGKYYAVKRSFKVLQGLVHGKWIVSMDWVFACSKAGGYVPEDKYEISAIYKCRNLHGAMGSPKRSRELAFVRSVWNIGGFMFVDAIGKVVWKYDFFSARC